ncbi:hypothetical protein POPTR_004G078932v4 [Populus trichocarpa]|uniref:Uncharacterized protein n=1 Tax=Populus trichocarpa TaxID=3694 RepID=A0ACC0T3K4_POPTR|nr:hypothetical protein POPTR_004G078932v4 [Populus trichocarpa]
MDQRTPGWKFNFWEMKGVPLRIEIGPRDVSSGSVVMVKSGEMFLESKEKCWNIHGAFNLEAYVKDKLDEIQSSLLGRPTSFRDSNIVDVGSYDELKAAISLGKWARGPWSASDADEKRVKQETGATIRCFPFKQPQGTKTCLMNGGKPAEEVAIFTHIESCPPSDVQMVSFGRERLPMVGPLVQIMHMRCRHVSWMNHDFIILVRVLSALLCGESQKFGNSVPRSE